MKLISSLVAYVSCFISLSTFALPSAVQSICDTYPHWNCNDPQQLAMMQKFETFISSHSHGTAHGYGIAAFDWDGTLYDEHIPNPDQKDDARSGQSLWHIWGADHLGSYPYLFPNFNTGIDQADNIKRQDSYLEGRTAQHTDPNTKVPLLPSGYDKFSQIAVMENGMTLAQMQSGIHGFLNDYSPQNYAFFKMLDVVQRFQDTGFVVWIVSGSNPYFLANVLTDASGVDAAPLGYHLFQGCKDAADNYPAFLTTCPIAGNGAKLVVDTSGANHFTGVYDDRFVKNAIGPQDRNIVDAYGKQLALQQLAQQMNLPVVFYAGNSDGDYYAMNYTLNTTPDSMGIFVQPTLSKSTKFLDLLNSPACAGRCIDVESPR